MKAISLQSLFVATFALASCCASAACDIRYQFMFQSSSGSVDEATLNGGIFNWGQTHEGDITSPDLPNGRLEAPIFNTIEHIKQGNTDNIHLTYAGDYCEWYQSLMTYSTIPDYKAFRGALNNYDSKLMLTSFTIVEPTTASAGSSTTSAATFTTTVDVTTATTEGTTAETTTPSEATTTETSATTAETSATTTETSATTTETSATTEGTTSTTSEATTATTGSNVTTDATVTGEPTTEATNATTTTTTVTSEGTSTITTAENSTTTALPTFTSTTTTEATTKATSTTAEPSTTAVPTTTIPLPVDARWFAVRFTGDFSNVNYADKSHFKSTECTICNFADLQTALSQYYYIGSNNSVSIYGIAVNDFDGNTTLGNFSFYGVNADRNSALFYYELNNTAALAKVFGIVSSVSNAYTEGSLPVPVDPRPPTTAPTTTKATNDDEGTNNRGILIVIIVACAGGIAIVVAGITCYLKRRAQNKADRSDYETESLQEYRQVNYY